MEKKKTTRHEQEGSTTDQNSERSHASSSRVQLPPLLGGSKARAHRLPQGHHQLQGQPLQGDHHLNFATAFVPLKESPQACQVDGSGKSCGTLGTPQTSSRPSVGTSRLLSAPRSAPRCLPVPNGTPQHLESTVTCCPCPARGQVGATGAKPHDTVQPPASPRNAPVPLPANLDVAPFQTEAP